MWYYYTLIYFNVFLCLTGLIYNVSYLQYLYIFFIIPILELTIPLNKKYLQPIKNTKFNDYLLYLWFPSQILCLFIAVLYNRNNIMDYLNLGLIFGQGINVAHELLHKNNSFDKGIAQTLLELSFYGPFFWQHTLGHHKNVGTVKDPATAPLNMSIYRFIPRSIIGTLKQAYIYEPSLFIKSMCNSFILLLILSHFNATKLYLFSCITGIVFLEIINYIEHYGLTRKDDEPVKDIHSWDAPFVISSILLFKLPLHADHHLYPYKKYSELEIKKNSPKMPYSYPIMFMLSFIPPLFFKIVNDHKNLVYN